MPRYRVTYQGRVPGAIGIGSWGAIVVDAPDHAQAKRRAWEVWEPLTGSIAREVPPDTKLGGPYVARYEDVLELQGKRCMSTHPVDLMEPRGRQYCCGLGPGHDDDHVDTRHPMHPSWRQT